MPRKTRGLRGGIQSASWVGRTSVGDNHRGTTTIFCPILPSQGTPFSTNLARVKAGTGQHVEGDG